MTHVHITDPRMRLRTRSGRLIVFLEDEAVCDWPLQQVDQITCFGPVNLSGRVITSCMDEDIPVTYLTRGGRFRGRLQGATVSHVIIKMAQFDRWQDTRFRIQIARSIVAQKIISQHRLLKSFRVTGLGEDYQPAINKVLASIEQCTSIEELMGYEGYAAKKYFEHFPVLLRAEIPFNGRTRRPPRDPVNAVLSLGYTLLGNEISGYLYDQGLEPNLGYLHGLKAGRQSLALDLLELCRAPVIDKWVLTQFNTKQLQPHDFEPRDNGGLYLKPDSLKRVLAAYESRLGPINSPGSSRNSLLKAAAALKDSLVNGLPYIPKMEL